MRRVAAFFVVGVLLVSVVNADDPAMPPAAPTVPAAPPGTEPPVLRGPVVPDGSVRTLVAQDMTGRFQRVEGRPEAAALPLLRLSPETRSAAAAVIEARAVSIREFLIDHVDELKASTDAAAAGDQKTAQRIREEVQDRFEPEHPRDPLLVPLSKVLSPAETEELRHLLDEYWAAWVESELRGGPKTKGAAIEKRLARELAQSEFKSAYESTLRPIQKRLERISGAIDPTPEQREAIRVALVAYVKQSRLRPSPEQRLQLSRAIYEALDEERRIKLMAAALQAE